MDTNTNTNNSNKNIILGVIYAPKENVTSNNDQKVT